MSRGCVLASGDGMGAILGSSGAIYADLSHTAAGDEEFARLVGHMKSLSNLRSINLRGTRVTISTLVRFKALYNLRNLDVSDARVSKDGIRELARSIPNLQIQYDERLQDPPGPND
ncbi:hypothetical protein V5E97_28505 [Singulisphaera sp. Ch08]|uniref:Leucine-rich repeat domain-containing protein n=1 Tax=Singulisphaera sp. Ch08 TaxID=3120278 RepID=A0AAU7CAW3_9BACT